MKIAKSGNDFSLSLNQAELLLLNACLAESATANAMYIKMGFSQKGHDTFLSASQAAFCWRFQDAVKDSDIDVMEFNENTVASQMDKMNSEFTQNLLVSELDSVLQKPSIEEKKKND